MSFAQQADIARCLRMNTELGPDRAFLKVQALAVACGVELRLCAAAPEGTTASPVLTRVSGILCGEDALRTMVWAKRGFIFWNEAVTFENYIRWDHAPEMFAVLLHDLGHVAAGGAWRVAAGAGSHLDVNEQGLADEDVAARWTRYAARGLWGLGSREERQMQRFDLMSGCQMPPKGPRFDPEPKPTDEQVAEASCVYDALLVMLRSPDSHFVS